MNERPTSFEVNADHLFIGHILVDVPASGPTTGFVKCEVSADAWLPFAIDLRGITSAKQRTPEDTSTCLYSGTEFVATVNATLKELAPYIGRARSSVHRTPKLL